MSETNQMKHCPYCGEEILAVAVKCKHCHSDLTVANNGQGSKRAVPISLPLTANEIQFFNAITRIGRLRYLAYFIGCYLLALIPFVIGGIFLGVHVSWLGICVMFLGCIFIVVMGILFAIRRLHDMNASGWWALLMLVPLVNFVFTLVLIFAPGTLGENRFGPQPPSNSGWVVAGVVTYIAIFPITGILAAIAFPEYQVDVTRSKVMEGLNLAAAAETAVEETYQAGQLPQGNDLDSNSSYGLPEASSISGTYVSSVEAAGKSGIITITYNSDAVGAGMNANTNLLILTPFATQNGIKWLCGNTTDKSGNITGTGTTVPNEYLPINCRP